MQNTNILNLQNQFIKTVETAISSSALVRVFDCFTEIWVVQISVHYAQRRMQSNSLKSISGFVSYFTSNTWAYFIRSLIDNQLRPMVVDTDSKHETDKKVSILMSLTQQQATTARQQNVSSNCFEFIWKYFVPYISYLTVWAADLHRVKTTIEAALDDCFADVFDSSVLDISNMVKQHGCDKTDALVFWLTVKFMKSIVLNIDRKPTKFWVASKSWLKELRKFIEKLRMMSDMYQAQQSDSQSDKYSSVVKLTDLCSLSFKELALEVSPDYIKNVDKQVIRCLKLLFSQRFKPKISIDNVKVQSMSKSSTTTKAARAVKQQTAAHPSYNTLAEMQTRRPKRLQRLFKANQQIRDQWRNITVDVRNDDDSISLPLDCIVSDNSTDVHAQT